MAVVGREDLNYYQRRLGRNAFVRLGACKNTDVGNPYSGWTDKESQLSITVERQRLAEVPKEARQPPLGSAVRFVRQPPFNDLTVHVFPVLALEAGPKIL